MGKVDCWPPRSAAAVLVQPWGRSVGLQVRMTATDPMGRGRIGLEVEACPPGAPFGDARCRTHTRPPGPT